MSETIKLKRVMKKRIAALPDTPEVREASEICAEIALATLVTVRAVEWTSPSYLTRKALKQRIADNILALIGKTSDLSREIEEEQDE